MYVQNQGINNTGLVKYSDHQGSRKIPVSSIFLTAGDAGIFVEGKKYLLTFEQNSRHTPVDKNKAIEEVLRSHQTRIRVVGCGGGGNNTVTRLMEAGVQGVETLAVNTDAQDLLSAQADDKLLIGQNITKGLGAGSNPQIGEDSARESQQEIETALQNSDMVFVTCGLGGGTGTGSAPVVAEAAKKSGALTIAIVTLPFAEEGKARWDNAWAGLEKLRQHSDTVIVIQNDRLLEVVPDLPLGMAFKFADEILVNAVKGITELITAKGLVNLDFADVRAIMQNGGTAMIGIGESESTPAAVEMAMQNRLLEVDVTGAKNALLNITGGPQMPLKDAKLVMKLVAEKLDPSAKIIWGARIDPGLDKNIRVMLIATGLPDKHEAENIAAGDGAKIEATARPAMIATAVETPATISAENRDAAKIVEPLPVLEIIAQEEIINNAAASPLTPTISTNGEEEISPKRKRKTAPAKPRKRAEPLLTDEQVVKLIDTSEAVIREEVERVTFAGSLTPPWQEPPAMAENHSLAPPATPKEFGPAATVNGEAPTARPTSAIPANPQNFERPFNVNELAARPAAPVTNGLKTPMPENFSPRPQPAVKRNIPPANNAGVYSKIFAEQSRVHLQTIRESLSLLFIDPTRQETLRRIKQAIAAINSSAQRSVFNKIADYAATIEEIFDRVLDGEINMSKKLVNAFTEIPAIFDGMIHGEADAFFEAKRHQERLQRLADSFHDGDVVLPEMHKKAASINASPPHLTTPPTKRSTMPPPSAPRVPQPPGRPRPATEVMDYLDDLFSENKTSLGR